ncbi:hypothetical protein [Effusibacillus consociatus]|uniref:Uncharacterized protein n=1 Tax=Effusibacillus consociatus TaxID=1117041 RepID=A0ABV9Q4L7_9BACL
MQYCNHCQKEVKTKESYGWQTWLIGLATWLIAGLYFKHGGWSLAIAFLVAGISSRIFKVRQCTECQNKIGKSTSVAELNEAQVSASSEILLDQQNSQSETTKPTTLIGAFKKGYDEAKNKPRSEQEIQKDLTQFEKEWRAIYKEDPPEVGRQFILEGGKLYEAHKIARKETGKPASALGYTLRNALKNQSESKDERHPS